MAKQEIEFVDVIADDDFSAPGGMVRKGEPFRCTRKKAKELVGTKQAHYATPEELEVLADTSDAGTEGDPEKLEAARTATQATANEGDSEKENLAKNEATKAAPATTKSTKASK